MRLHEGAPRTRGVPEVFETPQYQRRSASNASVRVIPAPWKLTLKATRDEALIHLLASPV